MLRPAPKPGTRQASAMEPVNRTRREEAAMSAAPARIARRVEEEEEEEVVVMVWMWERFCPTQQTRPSGPGCFPSLYCCCCFSSPPESPSKLRKRLVLLFGAREMGGCEFMLCRVDVYVWGSSLLSPLALFPSSPPPRLPASLPSQTHHNRPGSVTRCACARDVWAYKCVWWCEGAVGGQSTEEERRARWMIAEVKHEDSRCDATQCEPLSAPCRRLHGWVS